MPPGNLRTELWRYFSRKGILIALLWGMCYLTGTLAQNIDYDVIIPPVEVRPKTFEDYLVQLSWLNHPHREWLEQQIEVSKAEVKKERRSWMEPIGANVGFNSLKDTVSLLGARYLAPGYNYGFSLSLGSILTTKSKVTLAQGKQKLEELRLQEYKLELRKELLKRYRRHLLSIEVLKARQQAEEDAQANYTLISELFKKNKAPFEDLNQASISFHTALEKKLEAEAEVSISRFELEEILGTKWESLDRVRERYEKK
jgi:outer membrane protein TolC